MNDFHFLKEQDSLCDGLSGWVAFGQAYIQTGSRPVGTNESEPVYGLVEYVAVLSGIRSHNWTFVGTQFKEEYGILSAKISFRESTENILLDDIVRFVDDNYSYTHEKILFCNCGTGEIDCGDCCIGCCKLGQTILNKLTET